MSGYRTESCMIVHPDEIEQQWLDLQDRADCSWFQSWGWVGTWLEQIAAEFHPLVVKVWSDNRIVGMGIFLPRHVRRRLLVRSNALFLNEYPFDGRNMVIEYNGLLADGEHMQAVYRETIAYLLRENHHIDELFFSAIADREPLAGIRYKILEESFTWSVRLEGHEKGIDAYLATLSKNRRGQVRRSLRLYEKQGPLQLEEAVDLHQAFEFLDGLKVLHTVRWQSKGKGGSFANPRWEAFHRALIQARFPRGEIQLLKVSLPDGVIGYLYNFIWRKRVYVLQTGFSASTDKRLMPGYVVHVMAIAHNRDKGMSVYDLMHGDSLYKQILCSRQEKLQWIVVQRNRLKFCLEDLAVKLVRALRH